MRVPRAITICTLVVLVSSTFALMQIAEHQNQKVMECKNNLGVLRSALEDMKKRDGSYPADLLEGVKRWATHEHILDYSVRKYTRNPLDPLSTEPRVTSVFDGTGGWYYAPAKGVILPNYKRVRVWICPFAFRLENPQAW